MKKRKRVCHRGHQKRIDCKGEKCACLPSRCQTTEWMKWQELEQVRKVPPKGTLVHVWEQPGPSPLPPFSIFAYRRTNWSIFWIKLKHGPEPQYLIDNSNLSHNHNPESWCIWEKQAAKTYSLLEIFPKLCSEFWIAWFRSWGGTDILGILHSCFFSLQRLTTWNANMCSVARTHSRSWTTGRKAGGCQHMGMPITCPACLINANHEFFYVTGDCSKDIKCIYFIYWLPALSQPLSVTGLL